MDLKYTLKRIRTISPISLGATASGGKVGKPIDTAGYGSKMIEIDYGTVTATNATVTPVILEGDVTGTMTSAADADLVYLEASAKLPQAATRTSGTNKNYSTGIGYKGSKRYVSCNLIPTISGGIVASATVLLGDPMKQPTAA